MPNPWDPTTTIEQVGGVGEGAVHRGFLEKLVSPSGGLWGGVNVLGSPYNCKGDGTTDDTVGLQRAFDDVGRAGGGMVWLPPLKYRTTANLRINYPHVYVVGAFVQDLAFWTPLGFDGKYVGAWIYYDGPGGVDTAVIDWLPTTATLLRGGGVSKVGLDGNLKAAHGLRLRSTFRPKLEEVHINECVTSGFEFTDFVETDPRYTNNQDVWGLRMRDCSAFAFQNPWAALRCRTNVSSTAFTGGSTHFMVDNFFGYSNGDGAVCVDISSADDIWFYAVNCATGGNAHAMEWRGRDVANGFPKGLGQCGVYGGYLSGPTPSVYVRAGDLSQPAREVSFFGVNYTQDIGNDFSPIVEDGAQAYVVTSKGRQSGYQHQYRNSIPPRSDDFMGGTPANGSLGELGWNIGGAGAVTVRASEADHPGIIRLDTLAVAGTIERIHLGQLGGNVGIWADEWYELECVLRLTQNDGDTKIRFGLSSDPSNDAPANAAYLEKLYADTAWWGVTRQAGFQTRSGAKVLDTSTNWVTLTMRRQHTNIPGIYFSADNQPGVYSFGNIPTGVGLNPFLHIVNQAGVSKTVDVDFCQIAVRGLSRT